MQRLAANPSTVKSCVFSYSYLAGDWSIVHWLHRASYGKPRRYGRRQTKPVTARSTDAVLRLNVSFSSSRQRVNCVSSSKRCRQRPYAQRRQHAARRHRPNTVTTAALSTTAAASAAALNEDFQQQGSEEAGKWCEEEKENRGWPLVAAVPR